MDKIDVRIVQLEPLHVASTLGFGEEPEMLAWKKLAAWAKPRGLIDRSPKPRIYGFNNPSPSVGSPVYGYEVWIEVDPTIEPEGDIKIKDFEGGLYAVTRFNDPDPGNIYPTWQKLVAWVEGSPYRPAGHQWLEEHFAIPQQSDEPFILDLYMPVKA